MPGPYMFNQPFPDVVDSLRSANTDQAQMENAQALARINQIKASEAEQMLQMRTMAFKDWQRELQSNTAGAPQPGSNSPSFEGLSAEYAPLVASQIKTIDSYKKKAQLFQFIDPQMARAYLADATHLEDSLYKTVDSIRKSTQADAEWAMNRLGGAKNGADLALVMPVLRDRFGNDPTIKPMLDQIDQQRGMDGRYIWTPALEQMTSGLNNMVQTAAQRDKSEQRAQELARKEQELEQRRIRDQQVADAKAQTLAVSREALSIREKSAELAEQNRQLARENKITKDVNNLATTYAHDTEKQYDGKDSPYQLYATAERYMIDPNTNKPYTLGAHYDSSQDAALTKAYVSMTHPNYRGSVREIKELEKLGGIFSRSVQAFKGLAIGKELPTSVRNEMFNTMREKFMTADQAQSEREIRARAQARFANPDLSDADLNRLFPIKSVTNRSKMNQGPSLEEIEAAVRAEKGGK